MKTSIMIHFCQKHHVVDLQILNIMKAEREEDIFIKNKGDRKLTIHACMHAFHTAVHMQEEES